MLVIVKALIALKPPLSQKLFNLISFLGTPLLFVLVKIRGVGVPPRASVLDQFHNSLYKVVALTIPLHLIVHSKPSIYSRATVLKWLDISEDSVSNIVFDKRFIVSNTTLDSKYVLFVFLNALALFKAVPDL